jgi:hypothetical protein
MKSLKDLIKNLLIYRSRRSPRETIKAERTDEYEQIFESSNIRSTYFEQRIGETYIIQVHVKILVNTRFSSYNE